jgi:transposase
MSTTSSQSGVARVNRPERRQIQWRPFALEELLPSDHRARLVWQFVESLDLAPLYDGIRAVEGVAGRDAVDPRLLMALWLFATIEGVGSARQLDRLCERDLPYLWLCGEVTVNYHLLSDFRTAHADFLDRLLTDSVAALVHQGLVTLDGVAQDGMRVRAHAGSSSFRRRATLEKCQQEAREHVGRLRQQGSEEAAEGRRQAARERAARERQERVGRALEELRQLEEQKEQREQGTSAKARASTTDPEARFMKMGDGGFRPAYNVQLATDVDSRVIVGVDVTNQGSDRGALAPMHEDVQRRYGKLPKKYLVDCGFATKEDLTTVEQRGTEMYAPVHGEEAIRRRGNDPFSPRRGDTPEMIRFRQRMGTPEGRAVYRLRCSVAEYPNAEFRNHGLHQFRVRGRLKAKAVALWHALAFNLLRMIHLNCLPAT